MQKQYQSSLFIFFSVLFAFVTYQTVVCSTYDFYVDSLKNIFFIGGTHGLIILGIALMAPRHTFELDGKLDVNDAGLFLQMFYLMPLFEEFLFRELMPRFLAFFMPEISFNAIQLITSLAFAIAHVINIVVFKKIRVWNWLLSVNQILMTFRVGCALYLVPTFYLKVMLHYTYNTCLLLMAIIGLNIYDPNIIWY